MTSKAQAHKIAEKANPNPSSEGPRGNPGNHNNQGAKNARQVIEMQERFGTDAEAFIQEHETISGSIRYLKSEEYDTGAIAKYLGKRYQHVRNVLNQPLNANQDNGQIEQRSAA